MTAKGKHWHIDANGVLTIGEGFKRGKGFLPCFNDSDSITAVHPDIKPHVIEL